MNFLKTHFEKILFGAVLAAFLASLFITRPWARSEPSQGRNPSTRKDKPIPPIQLEPEVILGKLDTPFLWESSDTLPYLFTPNHRVTVTERTYIIGMNTVKTATATATPLRRLKRSGAETPKTKPHGPIATVAQALNVLEIADRPFSLQFRGFSKSVGTKKRYQINYYSAAHQGKEETQFVNEGETIQGFAIKEYRQKTSKDKDVSELTVQRGNEPVVTLIFNVIKEAGTEPVATIQDVASGTKRLYKVGDTLVVELEEGEHSERKHALELKIVDIQSTKVLLEDKEAKRYPLTK